MSHKTKRAGLRTACTKLSNKLSEELALDEINISNVKANIKLIQSRLEKIKSVSEDVLAEITDESEYSDELIKCDEYELKIMSIIFKAEEVINDDKISIAQSATSMVGNTAVKLPQIKLPVFDNTTVGWTELFDSFKAAVHDREDLSSVQKLNYLKGQLRGDAYTLIKTFPMVNSSYDKAIEILEITYCNKLVAALEYVDKLQHLKVEAHSLSAVRTFRAELESISAGLSILDNKVEGNKTAETLMTALMINKMPKVLKDSLLRTAKEEIVTLKGFRDSLETELTLLCTNDNRSVKTSCGEGSRPKNKFGMKNFNKTTGNVNKFGQSERRSKSNFSTTPTNKNNIAPYKCIFCDGDHSSTNCGKYSTLADRKTKLREKKRCMYCILPVHLPEPCNPNIKCYKCKGNHIVSVCPSKFGNNRSVELSQNRSIVSSANASTFGSCACIKFNCIISLS